MNKRKLTESCWAIRIGTFANSEPRYVLSNDELGGRKPRLFRTRAYARRYKHEVCAVWRQREWVVVRVSVVEA